MYFREPSADAIDRYLATQRPLAFTYEHVGATREAGRPAGYNVDRNRVELGRGAATFAAATAALRAWQMMPRWVHVVPHVPIAEGELIAILVRAGVWWLSAARLVYVIDEPDRFGFAYGTLPGHVERGEERFLVERLEDGAVFYSLHAFSRPRHWVAQLGYPATRALQRRFARDSMAAMVEASLPIPASAPA